MKHHRGSLLATETASGKRVNANQKPLGTGSPCSKEEEDDPYLLTSLLSSQHYLAATGQLAQLQIVTALRCSQGGQSGAHTAGTVSLPPAPRAAAPGGARPEVVNECPGGGKGCGSNCCCQPGVTN